MNRIFSLISAACLAALACISNIAAKVADFALSIVPTLSNAGSVLLLDNGHPRSPLASMRAGLA